MDKEEIQMRASVVAMALAEENPKKVKREITDEQRERNQEIVKRWFEGLRGK